MTEEWMGWAAIVVVGLCFFSFVARATSGDDGWNCRAIAWLGVLIVLGVLVLAGMVGMMVGG